MRIYGIELNVFWMSRLKAVLNWCFSITDAASFLSLSIIEQLASKPILVGAQGALSLEGLFQPLRDISLEDFPDFVSHAEWPKLDWVPDWCVPGFCNSTSWATFQRVGKTPLFKVMLKTVPSIPGLD